MMIGAEDALKLFRESGHDARSSGTAIVFLVGGRFFNVITYDNKIVGESWLAIPKAPVSYDLVEDFHKIYWTKDLEILDVGAYFEDCGEDSIIARNYEFGKFTIWGDPKTAIGQIMAGNIKYYGCNEHPDPDDTPKQFRSSVSGHNTVRDIMIAIAIFLILYFI